MSGYLRFDFRPSGLVVTEHIPLGRTMGVKAVGKIDKPKAQIARADIVQLLEDYRSLNRSQLLARMNRRSTTG